MLQSISEWSILNTDIKLLNEDKLLLLIFFSFVLSCIHFSQSLIRGTTTLYFFFPGYSIPLVEIVFRCPETVSKNCQS